MGAFVDKVLNALSSQKWKPLQQGFNVAIPAASSKVHKCFPLLPFAKSSLIPDSDQSSMVKSVWALILLHAAASFVQASAMMLSERNGMSNWKLPNTVSTPNFKILDCWEGMLLTLPLLYDVACRTVAVFATLCDVERSFSSLKWVWDQRQRNMQCDSHRGAVLLQYSGSVA